MSFPHQCKVCRKLVHVDKVTDVPTTCSDPACSSTEFKRKTKICMLVTKPTESVVVPEIGTFSPEKFPQVYQSSPNVLDPSTSTHVSKKYAVACGLKRFPTNASDQLIAVTCGECLKMAPGFVKVEEEATLTPDDIEMIEVDEVPNPFQT